MQILYEGHFKYSPTVYAAWALCNFLRALHRFKVKLLKGLYYLWSEVLQVRNFNDENKYWQTKLENVCVREAQLLISISELIVSNIDQLKMKHLLLAYKTTFYLMPALHHAALQYIPHFKTSLSLKEQHTTVRCHKNQWDNIQSWWSSWRQMMLREYYEPTTRSLIHTSSHMPDPTQATIRH